MQGSFDSLSAFDSSTLCVKCKFGNSSGLSPLLIKSCISSENKSILFLNTLVAETARGLST